MIMTMQANNQPQLLLAQHPNYYSPSQRDADDDTLLVAVVGADADDTLAAQQPCYYSPPQCDADDDHTTINRATTRPTIAGFCLILHQTNNNQPMWPTDAND
jgi:hypothetical protein